MKLTAEAVEKAFLDSLFTEAETAGGEPEKFILAEGLRNQFGFHPDRLESHRAEVKELLAELPDNFQASKGGGWSFLQACVDKAGDQWGEHIHMEQLFVMAIGLGLAKWLMPRDRWHALPGGMPYIVVIDEVKP